jgi:diguanylate cyclase (GGDEF)-like protein
MAVAGMDGNLLYANWTFARDFSSSGRCNTLGFRNMPVNDALGHVARDAVLVQVGERIKSVIRNTDFAGRIGGDEFVALLFSCDLEQAHRLAEAMIDAIADIPITVGGLAHPLGASIGLVKLSAGVDADTVLAQADAACYAAKNAGRGRIVVGPLT